MQIWRLQTNTDGGDVAKFCRENHVIAMGWILDDNTRAILKKNPTLPWLLLQPPCQPGTSVPPGRSQALPLKQIRDCAGIPPWSR